MKPQLRPQAPGVVVVFVAAAAVVIRGPFSSSSNSDELDLVAVAKDARVDDGEA